MTKISTAAPGKNQQRQLLYRRQRGEICIAYKRTHTLHIIEAVDMKSRIKSARGTYLYTKRQPHQMSGLPFPRTGMSVAVGVQTSVPVNCIATQRKKYADSVAVCGQIKCELCKNILEKNKFFIFLCSCTNWNYLFERIPKSGHFWYLCTFMHIIHRIHATYAAAAPAECNRRHALLHYRWCPNAQCVYVSIIRFRLYWCVSMFVCTIHMHANCIRILYCTVRCDIGEMRNLGE